jgi:hypothetical protein
MSVTNECRRQVSSDNHGRWLGWLLIHRICEVQTGYEALAMGIVFDLNRLCHRNIVLSMNDTSMQDDDAEVT